MNIHADIIKFISGVKDISIGYSQINFIDAENLIAGQTGYSVDINGRSLVTGSEDDWRDGWIVIATDEVGDPIIVDTNSPGILVLSAAHGEGKWEPFLIANSLQHFSVIIEMLEGVSKGRKNPIALEKNPIPEKEKEKILKHIEDKNPDAEVWYWENYFE